MNSGKYVIAAMLVVGAGLAMFAWWYRWQESQQILSFWGSEAADAIRSGEKVELLYLGVPTGNAESQSEQLAIGKQVRQVVDEFDITDAPGLIHARHHLLHENGFAWDATDPGTEPLWEFALRFTKGPAVATLALDFDTPRVRLLQGGREVNMAPIASAMRQFIDELTPSDASVISTPASDPG